MLFSPKILHIYENFTNSQLAYFSKFCILLLLLTFIYTKPINSKKRKDDLLNRKKPPLTLIIMFGLTLASLCMGTVFLMTASVADPELYFKITDPMVAYAGKKLEQTSEVVVKIQNKVSQTVEATGNYLSNKANEAKEQIATTLQNTKDNISDGVTAIKESFEPEKESIREQNLQALADSQALGEALLSIPRGQADYSVTHFEIDDFTEQEFLTGGTNRLIYFNQTDEKWGNYGYDSINGYGCGPTAMAMIVNTLRNDVYYTAQDMADIFVEEGFWCHGSGTYYHFADGSGERFGLTVEYLPVDTPATKLVQHLLTGKLAIALMGPGHFTNGGHYIVLHGATLTGDILVADPASRDRSLTTWDPQLILDELSPARTAGAPLWLFSIDRGVFEEEDSFYVLEE